MSKVSMSTEIAYHMGDEGGICTVADFISANKDDFGEAEFADMFRRLKKHGFYFGGGGAAPEFTITLASDFGEC